MTRQEFLDKEHEFNQSNDTDVVKFYHNIIMQIFNEQDDEITKTLEMGREGLLKVSSDLLDEKTKKISSEFLHNAKKKKKRTLHSKFKIHSRRKA